MIDLSVDELRKLRDIQQRLNLKYLGKVNSLPNLRSCLAEMKTLVRDEVGLECSVCIEAGDNGMWIPAVDITGRLDKHHQGIIDAEGLDIEQRTFESSKVTSDQLKAQGLDTDLLLG